MKMDLVYAKSPGSRRLPIGFGLCTVFCFLLIACGSSSPGEPDPQNTCTTVLDCQPGYDCVDGHCYVKNDGDSDGEDKSCKSTLDCESGEYCDTVLGICRSIPADLDESETDTESPDTDTQDLDTESDSDTLDGDPDTDDTDSESEEDVALTVGFDEPQSGAVVDGQVSLTITVSGPKPAESVQLFAGSTLLVELTAAPYTYLWDCNSMAEGPIELRAVAHLDGADYESKLALVLDHSAPTLTFISPSASGEEWNCEHEGKLRFDAGDHLKKLVVTVDGAVLVTQDSFTAATSFVFDLPASAKTPGTHTFSVRAEDSLGHAPITDGGSYHIDETPPKLVFENVVFDPGDPSKGKISVTRPLIIKVEDSSAISSVSITLRDSLFHTLRNIDNPALLPYTIDNYDEILYNPDPLTGNAFYPLNLTILATVKDGCGNTTTTSDNQPFTIEVNRLAWSFDLAQADPTFVPDGSFNQSAGAAADKSGNIAVGLFDRLIGLTPQGELRFNCAMTNGANQISTIASTPQIAETDGLPPLIVALADDGALWARVDDAAIEGCLRFTTDALTTDLTPPSLEAPVAVEGGVAYSFTLCGVSKAARSNSRCQRMTLTHLFSPGVGEESDSLSAGWQRDYLNFSPPTSSLVPHSLSSILIAAQGRRILSLGRTNGQEYNIDSRLSSNIRSLAPIPARNAVIAIADNELEIASELNLSSLRGSSLSVNIPNQVVSDAQGTFFVSQQSGSKGLLQAYILGGADTQYALYPFWAFTLEGPMGGNPAVGDNNTVYVAGANANGNIWAFNVYPKDIDPGPTPSPTTAQLRWRTRLQTQLTAPLTISPSNTLIVVGQDFVVRALTLNPVETPSRSSWSMLGGDASHSGRY